MYYVEPVNLHLVSKEKAWELHSSADGKLAEFKDPVMAYRIADLLNVKRAAAGADGAGPASAASS